jgi:hypothetical protein
VDASCAPLNNMLVLVVGGLPIAMPTILSVTMALGASALAKKKAIVSRLTAVEEIAGYILPPIPLRSEPFKGLRRDITFSSSS